jgi:hypothetical protein
MELTVQQVFTRVVACVQAVSSEPKFIHCSIHKESSAMKKKCPLTAKTTSGDI